MFVVATVLLLAAVAAARPPVAVARVVAVGSLALLTWAPFVLVERSFGGGETDAVDTVLSASVTTLALTVRPSKLINENSFCRLRFLRKCRKL